MSTLTGYLEQLQLLGRSPCHHYSNFCRGLEWPAHPTCPQALLGQEGLEPSPHLHPRVCVTRPAAGVLAWRQGQWVGGPRSVPGLDHVGLCVSSTLAWLRPVKLWGMKGTDHGPEHTPDPRASLFPGQHGTGRVNTGGLSQEGAPGPERAGAGAAADLWWPRRAEQSEAIYLLGWRRGQEREVGD